MLDSMKAIFWNLKLQVETWFAQMNFESSDIIRLVSCFGFGFLLGLVLRRSFKYLILTIVFAVLFLALLQYFDFITINVVKVRQATGTEEIQTADAAFSLVTQLLKTYALETTSGGIGFFLGLKTG